MVGRLRGVGLDNPFSVMAESVDGDMEDDEEEGEGVEGEGMEIGDEAVEQQN